LILTPAWVPEALSQLLTSWFVGAGYAVGWGGDAKPHDHTL
jgi:hypothetical protein